MKNFTKNLLVGLVLFFASQNLHAQEYRTLDGVNNNPLHPTYGAAGSLLPNVGTIGFDDGISTPAEVGRPNPRFISNTLFGQNTLANDPRGLSAYAWVWGQFIDHDITLSKDHPTENLAIAVPPFDAFFDPNGDGDKVIPMKRSDYDPATGTGLNNPRRYINSITAFIDASNVYGSDQARASWLRTFAGGKLKTSAGNLLPWNTTTGEEGAPIDPTAPGMAMPLPNVQRFFVAGDVRANENPFLTAMHTLFVREHNRLCDELAASYPSWSDEQLYQHARKLVGGIQEAIVYEEWLPTLGMEVEPYLGFQPTVDPGIMNVFNTAAYRYGHTTINSLLVRMDNEGNYMPQGDILLRDAFFNPHATMEVGGIESYLIGMSTVVEQDFDCKVIDDLRNFLFGAPGQGGMDLAAINIQRGRERGLPDYNTVRADFGLPKFTSFSQFTSDPLMNQALNFAYAGNINAVDPWVGILAENHMPDALFGKTAMTIIEQQFMDIRDGDRFYYEYDSWLTPDERNWIKQTRLADVIRRNTPVTVIQDDIFMASPILSSVKGEVAEQEIPFVVYPNPVGGQFITLRVEATGSYLTKIQIADIQGRTLLQREANVSRGNNTIALTLPFDSAPGLYIVTIQAGDKIGHQRLVKQ